MKIPTPPQMRSLGAFGGVVAGAVHMTRDTPWEMHPEGDECLHLLSGSIDVLVETGSPSGPIELSAGGGCVVRRGQWHRLVVRKPGDLLFITPTAGTRHRATEQNAQSKSPRADASKEVRSPNRAPSGPGLALFARAAERIVRREFNENVLIDRCPSVLEANFSTIGGKRRYNYERSAMER